MLNTPLGIPGSPIFSPTSLGLQEKPKVTEERLTPNTAANISEEGLRGAKGSEDREVCHKKTSFGHDMDSGRINSTAAVATIQDLHNTGSIEFSTPKELMRPPLPEGPLTDNDFWEEVVTFFSPGATNELPHVSVNHPQPILMQTTLIKLSRSQVCSKVRRTHGKKGFRGREGGMGQ